MPEGPPSTTAPVSTQMTSDQDVTIAEPLLVAISVAYSPEAGKVLEVALHLPPACNVAQALPLARQAVQQAARDAGVELDVVQLDRCPAGVWGRHKPDDHVLVKGDRLELYRPLLVDPKLARRQRFASQGARRAGLFAKRRPGGKAGY